VVIKSFSWKWAEQITSDFPGLKFRSPIFCIHDDCILQMIFSFHWKSERSQIYFTYITYKIALIDIYFREIHHIYNKYKTYLNRLKPSLFLLRHFLMQQEAFLLLIFFHFFNTNVMTTCAYMGSPPFSRIQPETSCDASPKPWLAI